jgi:hypothetical protein
MRTDSWVRPVRRYLRMALALEFIVELGFLVGMMAVMGVFNGGQPTNTPPIVAAYFAIGFLVTVPLIMTTRRLIDAAETANPRRLWRLNIRTWAWIAIIFSAVLPGIALLAAVSRLPTDA